ncbi:NAD(P)/FAD-dependent oxidoreductase [Acidicapsa dinghuensis]|uniref:NAD(P)/FAD-dependent oxidoreductase n=1 Tax=Acidicapsa dinghuensis TaxID=2218256 RepID=A0ABW1EBN1_9BACT|nr:NAD(P)/FAD-dependent oxidoreductase [Acidicapsa dinghuensis]
MKYDTIILGAGAAGLFCAATAAQRNRRVAVLEHGPLPGRKILISGGGRCNFTNLNTSPDRFLSQNPHFAKSALALYTPHHFLELVHRYNIPWHEKTLGQLFCDHSAHAILDMLLAECSRSAPPVDLIYDAHSIRVEHDSSGFRIECAKGHFTSETLVIATGGLSIPTLGATSFGYDLARQFGLNIIPPRPVLVPLTLGGNETSWTGLSGVSTTVRASTPGCKTTFIEKALFTHRGLSGPAILQISSYWKPGESILLDFAPDLPKNKRLLDQLFTGRRDQPALQKALRDYLPTRLADHIANQFSDAISIKGQIKGWTNPALEARERSLRKWAFHPSGTEGFQKAEVTAGGIDTAALNSRTMEAKSVHGLFFIGEVVDVTGHLGGYNFQWAWASAVAAARSV